MPVIHDPVRLTDEAAAVNHIGLSIQYGGQKLRVISRVVFKVGVLYDYNIARRLVKAVPECRSLPLIQSFIDQLETD